MLVLILITLSPPSPPFLHLLNSTYADNHPHSSMTCRLAQRSWKYVHMCIAGYLSIERFMLILCSFLAHQ